MVNNRQTRREGIASCNSNNNAGMSTNTNCKQKLKKLQMIDFSMIETILYLDAYPNNAEALKYYKALKSEREALLSEMKAQGCAPVTAQDAAHGGEWDWTDSPWPWEPEAN